MNFQRLNPFLEKEKERIIQGSIRGSMDWARRLQSLTDGTTSSVNIDRSTFNTDRAQVGTGGPGQGPDMGRFGGCPWWMTWCGLVERWEGSLWTTSTRAQPSAVHRAPCACRTGEKGRLDPLFLLWYLAGGRTCRIGSSGVLWLDGARRRATWSMLCGLKAAYRWRLR